MDTYKVVIENKTVVSAKVAINLQHGDIGINEYNKTLEWLAIESPDEKIAIEIAEMIVKKAIWK